MAITPIPPLGPVPGLTGTGAVAGSGGAQGAGQAAGGGFGSMLTDAIGNVNQLQTQADTASQALASGQLTDVATAVIAAEKASLGLQLAVQVRNKAIQAYQQVMQMQL